ncbi:hypothetical protein Aduo_009787 [Ancylostoma duodenale]
MVNSPSRSCSVPAQRAKRSRLEHSPHNMHPETRLKDLKMDKQLPNYMRTVIEILLETKEEIKQINRRNSELIDEVRHLREENVCLKQKLNEATKPQLAPPSTPAPEVKSITSSVPDDLEIKRSIVISGVFESHSTSSLERIHHDITCTNQLLEFLGTECLPTAVYRVGRPHPDRPRLLKVVLPCSRLQTDVIRRAPRLRFFFPERGIYIRPSLTKEERIRRREERLKEANTKPRHSQTSQNCANVVDLSVSTSNECCSQVLPNVTDNSVEGNQ